MKKLLTILFILPFFLAYGQDSTVVPDFYRDQTSIKKKNLNSIFQSNSIRITASSNGCFHSRTYYYKIIKKFNSFELTSSDNTKRTVSADNFNSLHKLFLHGLNIEFGGCTTIDDFIITDGKNSVFFQDGRCTGKDDILDKLIEILR